MQRKCNNCHELKDLNEFHKCKTRKLGHSYECKVCKNKKRMLLKKRYVKEGRCRNCGKPLTNNLKECSECYKHTIKDRKKYNEKRRIYFKKHRKNVQFRLQTNLRSRFKDALKNNRKNGSAIKDLGCSIEYLKTYLEQKFQPGMSWENYGKWHIDHIIPLSRFDLTKRDEIIKACHYTNLQPLWASDNLSKGNR